VVEPANLCSVLDRGGHAARRAVELPELARRQSGVINREQARAAGLTDDAIEAKLRAHRWRRVFDGVYATFSGPLPRAATMWAAVLWAGPGAMLSHESAAELIGLGAGLGADPLSAVHVTIPAARRVRAIPGVVVHRSRRVAQIRHPSRLPPQTRVEETVLDLAQAASDIDRAIGWIARACAQRLTTEDRLTATLAGRHRVRWRVELAEALGDVASGCHSLLELRYLRDVERGHGLPTGVRQQVRPRTGGRWYDDVCYQAYATLVELDGQAAHPADLRWRDMRRDNAGVTDGMSVLRYGMADVTERTCEVARQVVAVLRHNGWLGAPTRCGPRCRINELPQQRGKSPGS
jgi:hypothetical protein